MARQFKDLAHLQRYLSSKQVTNQIFRDEKIRKILAATMSQAVYDVVYGHYVPVEYRRRRNDGGLGDVRNMNFTKVEVVGDTISILFENLTLGQTHQVVYNRAKDTLEGDFLTDVIVEDHSDQWEMQGKWSESRDFISETVRRIQANPTPLINAIKANYKKIGFDVV